MELMEKNSTKKSKKCVGSIILYVAASVVAIIAVVLLFNNITLFNNSVAQYVEKGYPRAEVVKQLMPIQLIPGVFEPIGIYGGIAFVLFGAGIINEKVSKCLAMSTKVQVRDGVVEGNIDAEKQVETVEEVSEATEIIK